MSGRGIVAATRNVTHDASCVRRSIQSLLERLVPPLPSMIRRGDRILIKVNMGCSGLRSPEDRVTTHPVLLEAIMRALQDCGARVSFGDDVARAGKHVEDLWTRTGMLEVARRTGAKLVDFVAAGAREVRGSLLYPRRYLVTNAYFDTDVVINCANCRSHPNIRLSGAIKNMFGFVVGKRKALMHELFWDEPYKFSRAIADIHRTIPAALSFLDLTSVREGQGTRCDVAKIKNVGLILASTDPVALDTVAAHAIGYEGLPIWTTYHAHKFGLGEKDITNIFIRGLDWNAFERRHLEFPLLEARSNKSVYDRVSNFANHTFLRPRPVISSANCTGCGDCARRCPVKAVEAVDANVLRINANKCADCGCCLKVCQQNAVSLNHLGMARIVRGLMTVPQSADIKAQQ